MQFVVLGLGSNVSFNGMSSLEILKSACKDLSNAVSKATFSSVYKTRAMYVENQNDFYNMACSMYVEDSVDPFDFLKFINFIEAKYGRDRSKEIRFGPRSLDIDIEIFGDKIIQSPILEIPHPRIKERAFVLIPLLEIFSETADKNLREKYSKYLEELHCKNADKDVEKYCDFWW